MAEVALESTALYQVWRARPVHRMDEEPLKPATSDEADKDDGVDDAELPACSGLKMNF